MELGFNVDDQDNIDYDNPFYSHKPASVDNPADHYLKYSEELLGKGAFKMVYRALNLKTGIEVAWNEVNLEGMEPAAASKIFQEVKVLKDLSHPNIIQLYDHWFDGMNLVFTTELMPSGNLRKYLKRFPSPLPLRTIKLWCQQILSALYFLHTRPRKIIHRDIKAQNIFVDGADGTIKLGDLGLCASMIAHRPTVSCIGTPEFMAPEACSATAYTEKVDIYAFGMLLIEILTREFPYSECKSIVDILHKVTRGAEPKALEAVSNRRLKELIRRCINKDPERRPTAEELLKSKFIGELDNTGSMESDYVDDVSQGFHPGGGSSGGDMATVSVMQLPITGTQGQGKMESISSAATTKATIMKLPDPDICSSTPVPEPGESVMHMDAALSEAKKRVLPSVPDGNITVVATPGKGSLTINILHRDQRVITYAVEPNEQASDIFGELQLVYGINDAYRDLIVGELSKILEKYHADTHEGQEELPVDQRLETLIARLDQQMPH
ncbi:Kinase, WNK [Giardia muris]|uniref:Kinase, WNK n=1 Tax=Giardia muris TaxID=5742 RepID=A0A4Z1SKP3_GIAMU|nr:Kinase, WNK [Giardia muris]|eukprot:TNJ26224.1 Kinase, WNK [Giardia muris]